MCKEFVTKLKDNHDIYEWVIWCDEELDYYIVIIVRVKQHRFIDILHILLTERVVLLTPKFAGFETEKLKWLDEQRMTSLIRAKFFVILHRV